ncbi:hypothetical protein [Mannheimia varigena]|uniref:hypothetical protein n=1 Tax=Mannheimia varigena TaxID=85404 RepID=UPI0015B547F8|nr:hypothetical protein [Mannheimia varigena]QLD32273.1 hypothetical protein A6B42_00100 [Mannheimia varigena]
MVNKHINKIINSSFSLAFFTLISFATAYCYGWGQALFHGYPWWHVEVGNASMARSLAYVLVVSVLLFFCYALGYALINKVFKLHYFQHLGWLRVIVLVSVFTIPVILTFYVFTGIVPISISITYVLVTALSVLFFQKKWNDTKLDLDVRKMILKGDLHIFNLFIFLYFSLLALHIGYLRAGLRTTYDYIEIENQKYYILSTNSDNGYIMGEKQKDNDNFIFFNRNDQSYYRIYIENFSK